MSNLNENLRQVPSVDQLLRTAEARALRNRVGPRRATNIARSVIAEVRALVRNGAADPTSNGLLAEAVRRLEATAERESQAGIKAVINATGVLLHTNLGRAPLSQAAQAAIRSESVAAWIEAVVSRTAMAPMIRTFTTE